MEVVVDADGRPAPRLIDAHVPREQAAALYADLRGEMIRMLACDLVHGDLSPYNVLLGRAGPVVIDFPQVVGAAHNSQAEAFFQRDLQNLHRFFAALDPALNASAGDGREIWRAYVRRELTPAFVPTGRSPEPRSDHHRPPAGGAPRRPAGARPEQRDQATGPPSRPTAAPHARPPGPSAPRHPGRRASDRGRREVAMPEVIRVGRTPLGPSGAPQAAAANGPRLPAGPTDRAPGTAPRRRRRRRRAR
jgi:RIO kinase 1